MRSYFSPSTTETPLVKPNFCLCHWVRDGASESQMVACVQFLSQHGHPICLILVQAMCILPQSI